jgi:hypothetical protein
MTHPLVRALYLEYTKERNIELTEEQFGSFMAFIPALLVAASDGMVDKEEWMYCKKLASGLGNSFSEDDENEEAHENLTLIYRYEFKFLLKHLDRWEKPFLQALKPYLEENDYAKEFVGETIYLFASASQGISQEEMNKIKLFEQEFDLK